MQLITNVFFAIGSVECELDKRREKERERERERETAFSSTEISHWGRVMY